MNKSKIIVAMMLVFIIATTSSALVACNPKNNTKESVLMVGTTTVVDSLNRLDAAGGAPGYNFDIIASVVSQISAVSKIDGKFVGVDCDYKVSEDGKP